MVTRLEFSRGKSNGHYDAPKEAEKVAEIIFARTAVDAIKITLSAGPSYWVLLDRNIGGDLLPLGRELAEKLDHGLNVWISNGEYHAAPDQTEHRRSDRRVKARQGRPK